MLSDRKECYVCGSTTNLHRHHIYFGANRKISEKYDFTVYLCWNDHEGTKGVHGRDGHELDLKLKQEQEKKFINEGHTINEFIGLIGRNYLDGSI
jgi:hypothetical protein